MSTLSVDSLPITGSWVPTFTGFATPPTVVATYAVYGKICVCNIHILGNGTTNATTITMTVPFTPSNQSGSGGQRVPVICADNGAVQTVMGMMILTTGSNIADLRKTAAAAAASWTSGAASDVRGVFTYLIQ